VFRTIDRHVLSEWLKILGLVTGATFGVLMLAAFYDGVADLLEYNASAGAMIRYFSVLAPSFVSFVLPISVLISLLYALGQLHRHNEITALRAAGIGVAQATRWIWVVVAGFSAVLFYLNGSVIPWSVEQSRVIMDDLKFAHQARLSGRTEEVGLVHSVAFDNRAAGRLWMIARFSEYSHRAFGVQVSFLDAQRRETRRLHAAEGVWDEVTGTWEFFHGQDIALDPATADIVRPQAFERRVLGELTDDPAWMLLLEKRPKDLSLFELNRVINSPETRENPRLAAYKVRYHTLLAGTFSCLIVAGLAVPFAVSGVRVNPAVGVSKSITLFALFWLLNTFGTLLGERGAMTPTLAAWLPNIVMGLLAIWLLFRTR
jgi:lipopolysaccharide export system permease protein